MSSGPALTSPKSERTATYIGGALLVAVVAVAVVSFMPSAPEGDDVRVTVTKKRTVVSRVLAQGRVRAKRQVDVQSEVSGRVTEIFVRTGQTVSPGDKLFALDPEQAQNAVAQLRVALRAANASVARTVLMLEEAARGVARDKRLLGRGIATAEVVRASSVREQLSKTDLQQAQANRDRAHLEFVRAQDALKNNIVLAPLAGTVVAVGIEVGQVVAPLTAASSFGGGGLGGGLTSSASTPHVVIADLSELEARLDVDELDVARVHPGQTVQVRAQGAQSEMLLGRVTEVGLLGQQSGGAVMFPVELAITSDSEAGIVSDPEAPRQGPTRSLRPGMTVSADIEVERLKEAVAVPLGAVLEGDGREKPDRVFVVTDRDGDNGVAKERTVTLGPTEEDVVAILAGLQAGETVVEGPFRALRALEDGDAVHITETVDLPESTSAPAAKAGAKDDVTGGAKSGASGESPSDANAAPTAPGPKDGGTSGEKTPSTAETR